MAAESVEPGVLRIMGLSTAHQGATMGIGMQANFCIQGQSEATIPDGTAEPPIRLKPFAPPPDCANPENPIGGLGDRFGPY